jgi:hypothetical protein
MEPLWSPVVATGGNPWQIAHPQERRKQAKTVAVHCEHLHGKEGVDGSSPSEGFAFCLLSTSFDEMAGEAFCARRPPSVHASVSERALAAFAVRC